MLSRGVGTIGHRLDAVLAGRAHITQRVPAARCRAVLVLPEAVRSPCDMLLLLLRLWPCLLPCLCVGVLRMLGVLRITPVRGGRVSLPGRLPSLVAGVMLAD